MTEATALNRRVSDSEIAKLGVRLDEIEREFAKLRQEFFEHKAATLAADRDVHSTLDRLAQQLGRVDSVLSEHVEQETRKLDEMRAQVAVLTSAIQDLSVAVKEPLAAYQAAKAGVSFAKWLGEAGKALIPLLVGIAIALGFLTPRQAAIILDQAPQQQQQQAK